MFQQYVHAMFLCLPPNVALSKRKYDINIIFTVDGGGGGIIQSTTMRINRKKENGISKSNIPEFTAKNTLIQWRIWGGPMSPYPPRNL